MDKDKDVPTHNGIVGRLIKQAQRKLKMKRVGRKLFDLSQPVRVQSFEVWPGFSSGLVANKMGFLYNIDFISKIVTNNFMLDSLQQYRSRFRNNWMGIAKNDIVGSVVMTVYNKQFYRIDDISLEMSPLSTFKLSSGEEITFKDYYESKYKVTIQQLQ